MKIRPSTVSTTELRVFLHWLEYERAATIGLLFPMEEYPGLRSYSLLGAVQDKVLRDYQLSSDRESRLEIIDYVPTRRFSTSPAIRIIALLESACMRVLLGLRKVEMRMRGIR